MVLFCIGMSFVLTLIRERAGSVIPAAAAHGMFNGLAAILLLVAPHGQTLFTGPLGLLGAVLFGIIGTVCWLGGRRHRNGPLRSSVEPQRRPHPVDR